MGVDVNADGSCVGAGCVEYYRDRSVHGGSTGRPTAPPAGMTGAHVTFIYMMTICALVCAIIAVAASCLTCHHLSRVKKLTDQYERRAPEVGASVNGASDLLAQAAAWGAEVLQGVAMGVPVGEAMQRSTARIRLPSVQEHSAHVPSRAASDAGSDASRVSELNGSGDHSAGDDGSDWIYRAHRSVGSESPLHNEGERAIEVYEHVYTAQPPVRSRVYSRASASPPRARWD
tara:strand:- start:715 stop:1407 length:693 start_codon:yes stop_codon:yes gene_type:complete